MPALKLEVIRRKLFLKRRSTRMFCKCIVIAIVFLTAPNAFGMEDMTWDTILRPPEAPLMILDTMFPSFGWNSPKTHLFLSNGTEIVLGLANTRVTSQSMTDFIYNFDPLLDTKIIIHGYFSAIKAPPIWSIINGYHLVGGYNVIAINWKYAAYRLYKSSVAQTSAVGEYLAALIQFLVEDQKTNLEQIHLIGHSLGAHIAGIAGRKLGGKIGRITGLDPALPEYKNTDANARLDKSDAKFVDVIHTAGKSLGIFDPIGHADFYPNGGMPKQPGCNSIVETLADKCSHTRSTIYYSESIDKPDAFLSTSCVSWDQYLANECNHLDVAQMGHHTPVTSRGLYFLRTRDSPPFSLYD